MIARRTAREINCRRARETNWSARRRLTMDSLGMVRKLVDKEIPSNQAEVITSVITDTMENMSNAFVSKEQMKMSEIMQNANFSTFKSEIKSLQENNFSFLQRDLEKMHIELHVDIEKTRYELKMDIEKVHEELKVEHSKLKMDIEKMHGELKLELKMDIEKMHSELKVVLEKMRTEHNVDLHDLKVQIEAGKHDLKAQIEGDKYDVLKYFIGGLISLSALSFTVMKVIK